MVTRCHINEGDLAPDNRASTWPTIFSSNGDFLNVFFVNEETNCDTYVFQFPPGDYLIWCDSAVLADGNSMEMVTCLLTFDFGPTIETLPTDLDQDGCVDGADLGQFIAAWGNTGNSPADFNGDGVVDGYDLGQLIADWGNCVPI